MQLEMTNCKPIADSPGLSVRALLRHSVLGWVVFMSTSAWACEIVALTYPAQGSRISELQPELVWTQKSEGNYRVQVAAILPEARVILSLDTMTHENRLKLPVPIPSNLAAVKVLITQNCTQFDAQDLNAQGPAFFVNNRASCTLTEGAVRQSGNAVGWDPLPGASAYVVQLFEVESELAGVMRSKLLSSVQTNDTRWEIPAGTTSTQRESASLSVRSWVAAVQPVCNGLAGSIQPLALKPVD